MVNLITSEQNGLGVTFGCFYGAASGVYAYLEPSMDSLKKIAVFLYPGLL